MRQIFTEWPLSYGFVVCHGIIHTSADQADQDQEEENQPHFFGPGKSLHSACLLSYRKTYCAVLVILSMTDDGLVRRIPPWWEKADDSMNFNFQIFKFALRLISQQINDGFSNIAIGYLDM